jgi:hypothetical protein
VNKKKQKNVMTALRALGLETPPLRPPNVARRMKFFARFFSKKRRLLADDSLGAAQPCSTENAIIAIKIATPATDLPPPGLYAALSHVPLLAHCSRRPAVLRRGAH